MGKLINNKESNLNVNFYKDIRNIIIGSRSAAIRSVDVQRVLMYWRLGERILIEEQQGKDRAEYGEYLIRNLSDRLENEFGSGFGARQLELCRQFYRLYPIANALRSQLNWYQYRQKENNILTNQYQLYLPSAEALMGEIKDVLDLIEGGLIDG